jgi:small subunit ribosomal protein S17
MVKTRDIGVKANPPMKECEDPLCPWHGTLPVRGRIIEGNITSDKMIRTVIVRRDFLHLVRKYRRYERRRGTISARIPDCIDAKTGDTVRCMETRHLARNVSFTVIEKLEAKH